MDEVGQGWGWEWGRRWEWGAKVGEDSNTRLLGTTKGKRRTSTVECSFPDWSEVSLYSLE